MMIADLIEKLATRSSIKSSPEELHSIEEASGLILPTNFTQLWLSVGGCNFVGKIISGPKEGKYLSRFWSAPEILKKLKEDYDITNKSLPKIIPFGEDFSGNILFLEGKGDRAERVLVADFDNQRADLVAERFDEFVDSLILE